MKIINYPNLDEKLIYEKLDNGLDVYLVPKKEYHQTCAVFTTKFGGLNHGYEIEVDGKIEKVLPGAAHFLEHRIFDYKGKDVLNLFTKYGANVNAYTSLDRTSYYFSTNRNFIKSLHLLLDFVQEFNVSEESVDNEKNIIIQESLMYVDEPGFIIDQKLRDSLYYNHPYKGEIIGDIPSIKKTTFAHLKACHSTFYHPSNMILVIVGKMDVNQVLNEIKLNQNNKHFNPYNEIKHLDFQEKIEVKNKYIEETIDKSYNLVSVGFKLKPLDDYKGFERSKIEKCYEILLSMLYGETSLHNKKMIENKVYNDAGSYEYVNFNQMFNICISNYNVFDIDEYINDVKNVASNPEKYLLGEEFFEIQKKGLMSSFISEFNNLMNLALEISTLLADNNNFFDQLEIIKSIRYEDVVKCIDEFKKAKISVVVLRGNKND